MEGAQVKTQTMLLMGGAAVAAFLFLRWQREQAAKRAALAAGEAAASTGIAAAASALGAGYLGSAFGAAFGGGE